MGVLTEFNDGEMKVPAFPEAGRMDALGRLDSPVHRLDARAKIITTAVFVVVVMSWPRHEVSALLPMFAFPWLSGARAGLPAGFLLRKVLIASPFAVLVAIANPLLDRAPHAVIAGHPIPGGWFSFASIVIRFVLTVWSALVLVASTGVHALCSGMEKLGMPRVFGTQVLFLCRYLFVITEEGLRLRRAVLARGGNTLRLAAYGSLLGGWLLRSMERATRVHHAMCARGFDGHVRVLRATRPGWRDGLFALGWILCFAAARHWNLAALTARACGISLP